MPSDGSADPNPQKKFEMLDGGEVMFPAAEVYFSPDDASSGAWDKYLGEVWLYPNGWVELVDAGSQFISPHQVSQINPLPEDYENHV